MKTLHLNIRQSTAARRHSSLEALQQFRIRSEGRLSQIFQNLDAVQEPLFIGEVDEVQGAHSDQPSGLRLRAASTLVHEHDFHVPFHRETDGFRLAFAELHRLIHLRHLRDSQPRGWRLKPTTHDLGSLGMTQLCQHSLRDQDFAKQRAKNVRAPDGGEVLIRQ